MNLRSIDYRSPLPEDEAEEAMEDYLRRTDASSRAAHPDYQYFVYQNNGTFEVLEIVDSDFDEVYNHAILEEGIVIEEKGISWDDAQELMER
jgi:hypothetical protein